MKKKIFTYFLLALLAGSTISAQTTDSTAKPTRKRFADGRNTFKMNLSSLAFSNYHFTYERSIGRKVSLSLGFRYMPTGDLPYQAQVKDLIKSNNIDFGNFKLGGYAITPEFRFYTHSYMRGFYIAPYVRYSNYDMTVPVTFTVSPATSQRTALFSGTVTAFTGGVLFGTQQNIFRNCVIDFWMLGANFGNSFGTLNATNINPALNTQQEKDALQNAINNINATPFKVIGKVTSSTTAYLDAAGPWLGVRALGISFGIRF